SGTMCLDLGGTGVLANSFAGTGAGGTTDFRIRQRMATTVRLPGYSGANTDTAAVIAFISGRNTGSPSGAANTNVSPSGPDGAPFGGGFIGGAVCTGPTTTLAQPIEELSAPNNQNGNQAQATEPSHNISLGFSARVCQWLGQVFAAFSAPPQ